VLVIGLTGGIGSGKSTVAALLAERGAVVIDVDRLGREVIAPSGRAERAVIEELGAGICDAAGHIDRAALARMVFAEPEALARLTRISHPAINAELAQRLDALPQDAVVVLDMAILVESNLGRGDPEHSYSRVISVEAPTEVRIERAVTRGMARADVEARIAAQASDAERRAVADIVVTNDADLVHLFARVDELWATIRRWRVRSAGSAASG
jgi:dephospho-CoA kinase